MKNDKRIHGTNFCISNTHFTSFWIQLEKIVSPVNLCSTKVIILQMTAEMLSRLWSKLNKIKISVQCMNSSRVGNYSHIRNWKYIFAQKCLDLAKSCSNSACIVIISDFLAFPLGIFCYFSELFTLFADNLPPYF